MNLCNLLRVLIPIFIIIALFPIRVAEASSTTDVVPINWNLFDKGNPDDENAQRIEKILLNTNKYGLTTWWDSYKNFDLQKNPYLSFGGKLENEIRHPAAMSLGLATSFAFNIYNPSSTNVSEEEAKEKTLKLISSLAYRHKANIAGGWGDQWQSAHWAYFTGFAGWLMWDELSAVNREYVQKMVEYEANRFNDYFVPYMKTTDGDILYPGDTKAEENAWNAQLLQLATAMMPNHPNRDSWMEKNIDLMISSAAIPSDTNNETVINGQSIKDWIRGSNVNEDGTVINQGYIHPDYMEFITFNNSAALHYTLANMSTPNAAFFNSDLVYKSLVNRNFESPPFDAPGGAIYREDSSDIYYPQGNYWGNGRRMQFATLDIFANAFHFDSTLDKDGAYWEPLHAQKVLDMQNRHSDGHTYADNSEDIYTGKEEWVAHHAAWAWIAKWVAQSGKFHTTNASFIPFYQRLAGSSRYETAERISQEGWLVAPTVFLARGDSFPDALAGTPLAFQNNSPILLTEKNRLSDATKREIQRLKTKKVIILGGASAVEKDVEDQLKNMGLKIERIAGETRFETASKIAEKVTNTSQTAIVVYGYNFPDALSVAAIAAKNGYPILLTETNTIPNETKQALKGISNTYVIGGESVISNAVINLLPSSNRIGGENRFETAANVIKEFNLHPTKLFLANRDGFSDALAGSVLAAKKDANILLVEKDIIPTATQFIFDQYPIQNFVVLGGKEAVSDTVINTLKK
ncbi:cell wall-binding repeat-containing protein [Neobacillus sp. OS1-2]|uniref:cell wall-binding repeat-containing protein n=1 Tax=Neobacillus sp. OS1-2 TaxID=3070680 RepID=UPI0027E20A8D|nr:cell wall-binding repeat-containing protein [Neobacillus sp. OS1-2]WML41217.1 cell wall-binding repeat-containing protein [Neobacillus sp. OS1-2]